MGSSDSLLELLRAKDQRERLDRHLEFHRVARLDDQEFALTPRTRRLRRYDNEEEPGRPHPFVLIQMLPTAPPDRPWSLRDDELRRWLSPDERRYAPYRGGYFLFPFSSGACGGLLFDHDRQEGQTLRDYVFLGQDGLIEIGLCNSAARCGPDPGSSAGQAGEQVRTYFLLLPVVGTVWRLLQFAHEWYERIGINTPPGLIIAARDTRGSQLGGFAEGWEEPWEAFGTRHAICPDPALRLLYPSATTGDADTVEPFIRDMALEFEAGWGMLPQAGESRCFIASGREGAERFDEGGFARLMR